VGQESKMNTGLSLKCMTFTYAEKNVNAINDIMMRLKVLRHADLVVSLICTLFCSE